MGEPNSAVRGTLIQPILRDHRSQDGVKMGSWLACFHFVTTLSQAGADERLIGTARSRLTINHTLNLGRYLAL